MSLVFLGLGSNRGDKRGNIEKAIALIAVRAGEVPVLSGFYEMSSWGYVSAETYLNAVAKVETGLSPSGLLTVTQMIEKELGREDKTVNGVYRDRIIDIDILLYDNLVLQTPELTIPHPLMLQRRFVMQPLSEIAPDMLHPVSGKTMEEHYCSPEDTGDEGERSFRLIYP